MHWLTSISVDSCSKSIRNSRISLQLFNIDAVLDQRVVLANIGRKFVRSFSFAEGLFLAALKFGCCDLLCFIKFVHPDFFFINQNLFTTAFPTIFFFYGVKILTAYLFGIHNLKVYHRFKYSNTQIYNASNGAAIFLFDFKNLTNFWQLIVLRSINYCNCVLNANQLLQSINWKFWQLQLFFSKSLINRYCLEGSKFFRAFRLTDS